MREPGPGVGACEKKDGVRGWSRNIRPQEASREVGIRFSAGDNSPPALWSSCASAKAARSAWRHLPSFSPGLGKAED